MSDRTSPTAGSPDALERLDALERAIAAVPAAPPPPSLDAVWAAIDASHVQRPSLVGRPAVRIALAASLVAALGLGIAAIASRDDATPSNAAAAIASVRVMDPATVDVLRGSEAVPGAAEARPGDIVFAKAPARLLIGRATVDLDAYAALELSASDGHLVQRKGRARYAVEHARPGAPAERFVVHTRSIAVEDLGTRFTVDVAFDGAVSDARVVAAALERVIVTVEEGSVSVSGSRSDGDWGLGAGRGLALVGGRPTGPAWSALARPTLSIEPDAASPRASEPLVLRVTLSNGTDDWIALPAFDRAHAPLWIDVTAPDGSVHPVRVTEDRLVGGGMPAEAAIAPRGHATVRVRFDRTFASPGTYRLRAVHRAADAVESPASPEVTVTVR